MAKKAASQDANAEPADQQEQDASQPASTEVTQAETNVLVGHAYDVEIPHCHLGRKRIVVPLEQMEEGRNAALAEYMKQSGMSSTSNLVSVVFAGAAYKDGTVLEK